MHKLPALQFLQINDGNSKLCGTMTGGGVAGFGRNDSGFGALASEPGTENSKFVECFRLDLRDLSAEKQGDDSACGHHVDFVRDAAVS